MDTLTLLVLLISIICLTIPLGMQGYHAHRRRAKDYHAVPLRPQRSALES